MTICRLSAVAVASLFACARLTSAAEAPRVDGPYVSGNLAVYLVHGPGRPAAHGYLTLREGLAAKSVVVHEVAQVNQLEVENASDQDLFLQAGEIVKGGRQDRTLARDLLVSAHSGRMPIDAHCVEHGRWTQRGSEGVAAFASSENMLATKSLKQANYSGNQSMVWENVAKAQLQLAKTRTPVAASNGRPTTQPAAGQNASFGAARTGDTGGLVARGPSTAPSANTAGGSIASESAVDAILVPSDVAESRNASPTSLQLTLEDKGVQTAAAATVKGLPAISADRDDVVGFVFAVNGKLDGGDVYASHALLAKMYPKLLTAAALEAVIDRPTGKGTADVAPPPTAAALAAALAEADAAAAKPVEDNARVRVLVEQRQWANAAADSTASTGSSAALQRVGGGNALAGRAVAPTASTPTTAPSTVRAAVVSRSTDILDEYETRDTAVPAEPFLHRAYLAK